ncbi:WD repeat and SOCS box-containing protein [Trichinella pseudospiralis]
MVTNTNFLHELMEISSPQGQLAIDADARTLIAFAPQDSAVAWTSQGCFITVVLKNSTDVTSQKSNALVCSIAFGYASLSSFMFPLGAARNGMRKNDQDSVLLLAVGMDDGSIRIYCPKTGCFLMQLLDHRSTVGDIKFSPPTASMRSTLLSCSRDSTLKLWDMDDQGNMFKTLEGHGNREVVTCCSWSFDGKYAASGGTDTVLIIWETARWTPFHYLRHFTYTVELPFRLSACLFLASSSCSSNHCQHMATVCDDGNVRIWSIQHVTCPKYIKPIQDCSSVAYSCDGSALVIGDKKGSVQVYSARMTVPKMAFLARKVVLQNYTEKDIMKENIPHILKNYLQFSEVGARGMQTNKS